MFSLDENGSVQVSMPRPIVDALGVITRDLRPIVDGHDAETASIRERLYPRAYLDPTEEAAEQEWQSVVHEDLVRTRLERLAAVTSTLERGKGDPLVVTLDGAEVEAWLGVMTDARLALGIQLGVDADTDLDSIGLDDPRRFAAELYLLLTDLQEHLLQTVLGPDE